MEKMGYSPEMNQDRLNEDRMAEARKRWDELQANLSDTYDIRDTLKTTDIPKLDEYRSNDYQAKDTELRRRQAELDSAVNELLGKEYAEGDLALAMELRNTALEIEIDRRLSMYAAEKFDGVDQSRVFWRSANHVLDRLDAYIKDHAV